MNRPLAQELFLWTLRFAGLVIFLHEALFVKPPHDPLILIGAAAMMGLREVIRADERRNGA